MPTYKTVKITYGINTPLVMAGAVPLGQAELRVQSIKGILRFWYRAIDADYRQHEMRIFGGTSENVGQSSFLIRIEKSNLTSKKLELSPHAESLAYGTKDRYCFKEGTFTLKLLFKPDTPEADIKKVKEALWAMSMFGGLGAKSRKGFGSLKVLNTESMEELPPLTPNINDLPQVINQFINKHVTKDNKELPEHTCWSNNTRCVITGEEETSALNKLSWLGENIHHFRSVNGDKARCWAKEDATKMYDLAANGIIPKTPPKRAAFGLPHNYYFPDLRTSAEVNYKENNGKGRRASPLLFKIYEQDGYACVIATFFPARLIPSNAKVEITGRRSQLKPLPNDFSAIEDLLDQFKTTAYNGKEV